MRYVITKEVDAESITEAIQNERKGKIVNIAAQNADTPTEFGYKA
ncbi:hypothetical protein [Bradyrhizobium sp. 4]|nr:hypothetical protein [Bradyrhizobium sp. 4]